MALLNRSSTTQIVEAPKEEAHQWLCDSLGEGFDLSAAVLATDLLRGGQFLTIVSSGFQRSAFDYRTGGVIFQEGAREKLAHLLAELRHQGATLVVVEDNIRSRRHPSVSRRGEPTSFIGDRVIHWAEIGTAVNEAAETVAYGASGYPLNAFVVAKASSDLGLVDGEDAPENLAQEVAANLRAIVVAAFDAESFLIWTRDALTGHAG